ncbi:MAG: hypothetical protein ACM3Y9_00575 [Ignavibacteria bacterium]
MKPKLILLTLGLMAALLLSDIVASFVLLRDRRDREAQLEAQFSSAPRLAAGKYAAPPLRPVALRAAPPRPAAAPAPAPAPAEPDVVQERETLVAPAPAATTATAGRHGPLHGKSMITHAGQAN